MTRFQWLVGAGSVALVLLIVAQKLSADDQTAPKAAPAAGPAPPQPADVAAALRSRLDTERFVREFESFPLGIDLEKELKVTDEQSEKLVVILDRVRRETNVAQRLLLLPPGEPNELARKRVAEQNEARTATYERAKKEIEAVLSPEQLARAKQISLQARLKLSGMARGLADSSMAGPL